MNFTDVHAEFLTLRKRLVVIFGPTALPDITIEPPKRNDDELSFVRLVAWGYVLLQESGKISLNYLRRLPPWNANDVLLPYVRSLRTWCSHNLSLDKDHDKRTLREAIAWFSANCGAGSPERAEQWERCFNKLADDLRITLRNAIAACDAFEVSEDRERLVKDLQSRLERQWEGYKFDDYVVSACNRFGYQGLNITEFRNKKLEAWRKIVVISLADDLEKNLILRIETDILEEFHGSLPISAEELTQILSLPTPNHVVAAMLFLRAVQPAERKQVLELLRQAASMTESESTHLALTRP